MRIRKAFDAAGRRAVSPRKRSAWLTLMLRTSWPASEQLRQIVGAIPV
jgi:hypothetical protein